MSEPATTVDDFEQEIKEVNKQAESPEKPPSGLGAKGKREAKANKSLKEHLESD